MRRIYFALALLGVSAVWGLSARGRPQPQTAPAAVALARTHWLDEHAQRERAVENMAATVVANSLSRLHPHDHKHTEGSALCCVGNDYISVCLAPGTSAEYAKRVLASLPPRSAGIAPNYNQSARWTNTASGATGAVGNPITLTYSFIPDGTTIPAAINGQVTGPSSLFARMDALFGGNRALWQDQFRACFNRWGALIGVRYIEVSDDGASFPGSSGRNTAPIRGDIRIGMVNIDGASNVLAYNYFPNTGDMVLDRSENWYSSANTYRFLRNVVMHEHGHGQGLGHVLPRNGTKLMEAFLSTSFDGPQDDDIRGGHRNYGDTLENNDTVATATNLSPLDGTVVIDTLSTDSAGDIDWFVMDAGTDWLLTVRVEPIGSTYSIAPDPGTTTTINTLAINNLEVSVFASDGTTLLRTANAQPAGGSESISKLLLNTPRCYVRVSNSAGAVDDVQRYRLTITLRSPATFYVDRANATAPFNGTMADPFQNVLDAINHPTATADRMTRIFVRANSYNERPNVNKPIRIVNWGNTGVVAIGRP